MIKRLILLLFLLPAFVLAAVPTVGTTKTAHRIAEDSETFSNFDQSHTIDSSTTLVVVNVWTAGDETGTDDSNFSVKWDPPVADQALTRINLPTRTSKTASDPHVQTWALLNPTVKTANMNFNLSAGTYANTVIHITNYIGTSVASLGAAVSFLDDTVNLSDSTTCVISSAGAAGNLLYAVAAWKGTDTDPLNLSSGWTSISTKYDDPGNETGDWATHLVTKNAASAITFTAAGVNDTNMCILFEVAPPATGAIIPTLVNQARRRKQ